MSVFTNDEKQILKEALTIYLQMVAQQSPQALEPLGEIAKSILFKADKAAAGSEDGEKSNKPHNISDEWYDNVCINCENLDYSGCTDSVTAKYPGKCDPILKYEFEKNRKSK
jgi:hypothetical protein